MPCLLTVASCAGRRFCRVKSNVKAWLAARWRIDVQNLADVYGGHVTAETLQALFKAAEPKRDKDSKKKKGSYSHHILINGTKVELVQLFNAIMDEGGWEKVCFYVMPHFYMWQYFA